MLKACELKYSHDIMYVCVVTHVVGFGCSSLNTNKKGLSGSTVWTNACLCLTIASCVAGYCSAGSWQVGTAFLHMITVCISAVLSQLTTQNDT